MVSDHPQGIEALDKQATRGVDDAFATIEELCAVDIPDLAVLLSPDVQGMALLLASLRRAAAQLKWATEQLEDEITKVMPGKVLGVAGLGQIELRTGTSRKGWDKEGLVRNLTHQIATALPLLANAETGEVESPQAIVETVLDQYHIAATPSWKSTGLRQFHINPDEYCEVTWGRKTIQTPVTETWSSKSPEQ